MQEIKAVCVINIIVEAEEENLRHNLSQVQEARSLCKSMLATWMYNPKMWTLWKIRHTQKACYKKQADQAR